MSQDKFLDDVAKTHPWMTFRLDSRKLPQRLFVLLGEAQSKCEHIAGVPLKPVISAQLHQTYLAKGITATTAIEGNTLSEKEVEGILRGDLELPKSREYLGTEVRNVLEALHLVGREALLDAPAISVSKILEYNRLILADLELPDGVVPGEFRRHSVGVGRYLGARPEHVERLVGRLCDWLNEPQWAPSEDRVVTGIIRAVVAHLYLEWIHPFGDGNGRTGRLLEFRILLSAGVPTPAAHLLSNFYNRTRQKYYRELDHASKSGGDLTQFLLYAAEGFVDELREQIGVIREYQWDLAWRDYVHELLHDDAPGVARKRQLALDLAETRGPVSAKRMAEVSPRVAREYGSLNPKTLDRDTSELLALGLIRRTPEGYVACREVVLQFLPKVRESEG